MMSERFRLEALHIKGFRGFPEQAGWQNLSLKSPCTVIYGVQGGGKSSTLHAVEWCLFGRQVASKSTTGIQERKSWLIQNQHSQDATVQLTLRRGNTRLDVERCTRKRGDIPEFLFRTDTGNVSTDEAALHQLLGIELADYMSCVHLHQELVSGLMLQDPKDRKNSFERLLGLTDLRNFFEGIKKSRLQPVVRDLKGQMALATQKLQTHLELRAGDLEQARREARRLGWPRVERADVLERCAQLLEGLRQFGPLPDAMEKRLQTKHLDTSRGLDRFLEAGRDSLRWLREQQPLLQRERALRGDKEKWLELQKKLALMQQFVESLSKELLSFQQEYGDRETLQAQLAHLTIAPSSEAVWHQHTNFLQAAQDFLATAPEEELSRCPLCQREPFDAAQTQTTLQTKQETLHSSDGSEQASHASQDLHEHQKHLDMLLALEDKWQRTCLRVVHGLQECNTTITQLLENLPDPELRQEIQAVTADFTETYVRTDPGAAIERYIQQVDTVLSRQDVWLAELQNQSTEAQASFRRWEEELEALVQARNVLELSEEVEDLEQLQTSDELLHVQTKVQAVETYVQQVTRIQDATSQLMQELAEQKLGAAREAISQFYRQLSGRVDFPEIVIDVEKFEVMAARGDTYEVALRFFNKGDINCAALSIFLALASSSLLTHHLDFILLDDPSQHMDRSHKQKLAQVLAQVQQERQLVIATAEPDFLQLLQDTLPTPPQVYAIQHWDAQQGPTWNPSLPSPGLGGTMSDRNGGSP